MDLGLLAREMDNAAEGRRGLRATPSLELFQTLYDHYGINVDSKLVDLGGSSNLNLLVYDADRRYVLRVYRPYVTENRLADIQLVRNTLSISNHGVNCSETLLTFSDRPWVVFGNRLLEVEHYVENDTKMDSWECVQAGLPVLGMIHTTLQDIEVSAEAKFPIFANYIESNEVVNIKHYKAHNVSENGTSLGLNKSG